MPWDVLHQGIALQGGWSMGRVAVATSFAVLLAWIPIRQKPGLGTISNAIVIGLVFDAVNGLIGEGLAELARSAEHTSELQSIMRLSYAVFGLTKTKPQKQNINPRM